MWDMDNKEYIDFRCSLGPIILGYQYAEIDRAVRQQMDKGALFSMASPLEIETAEAILDTVGWADKIRFMKTGADACACSLRLARSFTGRDHLLTSGYHGYQDWVVYKKRMLFCIFSCTNSVRQFILSAWLLKLLIVGTVEVKISLNLARRPTINSATAAMIVVNKAAKTPQ